MSVQLDESHSFAMAKTKHVKCRYYSTEEEEEAIKRIGDMEGPEETQESQEGDSQRVWRGG